MITGRLLGSQLAIPALVILMACSSSPQGAEPTPPDDYVDDWVYFGMDPDGSSSEETFVIFRHKVWRCDLANPNEPVSVPIDFDWSCVPDPAGPTPFPDAWPGCDAIPACRGDE